MEQTTHTPAFYARGNETNQQGYLCDESDPTGRTIAVLYDFKRDGEFLVRAANSHAELLEALENLMPLMDDDGVMDTYSRDFQFAAKAISRAKGDQ